MNERKSCAIRPDAQAFDEIRIITVPRFKESELSGDEWRIHAEAQFYRKGRLIFTEGARSVESVCHFLSWWYARAIGDGKAYFAGDGVTCDQEGCHEPATVRYRRLASYCREGHKTDVSSVALYRHFCEAHKERGDCALDDADANYESEPYGIEDVTRGT
jgi:hypothetical protein